jgi:SAM-dependent methyltransferase
MRSLRLAVLALGIAPVTCDRAGTPLPPPEPPATTADEATSRTPEAVVDTTDAGEAPIVGPELNAPYAKETSVEGWVERFEREGREVHDHRDRIVAALRLTPGMRVADLGAGTGLFTFPMAKAVGPNGHVFAVDVQPYFLEHLRARTRDEGLTNVTTVVADQRSPNLEPNSIDLAFFCDVYHHVEYPQTYLASLRRALREGGRLVVVDYVRDENESPAWLLEHIRASPEVFRAEIEQAGFRFVRRETFLEDNFFFEFELAHPP